MSRSGPTTLYCAKCKTERKCWSDQAYMRTQEIDLDPNKSDGDIRWYQRGRTCDFCTNSFLTAELDVRFLEELILLREKLDGIKGIAKRQRQLLKAISDPQTVAVIQGHVEALKMLNEEAEVKI